MKTLNFTIILAIFATLVSCKQEPTISVTNDLDIERTDGQVVITKAELQGLAGEFDNSLIPLLHLDDNPVITQTDDLDGDGNWDELVFTHTFPAKSTIVFNLSFVRPDQVPDFKSSVNVHLARRDTEAEALSERTKAVNHGNALPSYQPNQMDGPAWENDKVGYRMYFDGRNARDVFAKRTSDIVLPDVGYDENNQPFDNYHTLHDWGRDVLSVGNSTGAGGIAMLEGDSLVRLGLTLPDTIDNVATSTYELINKGPVRAIFRLTYEGWNTGTDMLTVDQFVSIWKGSQAYKTSVMVTGFEGNKNLVIGMVNSNNDMPEFHPDGGDAFKVWASHDKQSYNKEFFLGLALAVPAGEFTEWGITPDEGPGITTASYAVLSIKPAEYLTYLVFSGCELQDGKYKQKDSFQKDVERELMFENNPLKVE